MRGLSLLLLLASFAPVAGAAPHDCTGQNVNTDHDVVALRCDRSPWYNGTRYVTGLYVEYDSSIVFLGASVEHDHGTGSHNYAMCRASVEMHPGVSAGRSQGCAGVRHPLMP